MGLTNTQNTTNLAVDTNESVEREVYDKQGMLTAIREQFKIDWHGIHGANHWARVLHHGMAIGTERSADLLVVELFAFLHDSQGHNDDDDDDDDY